MFNSKNNFKKTNQYGPVTFYESNINNYNYIVTINRTSVKKSLRIQFDLEKKGQGITGTGNAFLVIGSIINLIKDIMKDEKILNISFSSRLTHKSRIKVYDKIVEQLIKKGYVNNYEVEDDSKDREYFIEFNSNILKRKNIIKIN